MKLISYKDSYGILSASHDKELMGQDVLNVRVLSATKLDVRIGDYIEYFGERFKLNELPIITKNANFELEYSFKFEGVLYDLLKVIFLDIDDTGFAFGTTFSLIGNVESFLKLIVRNLNRIFGDGTWQIGTFPSGTEMKALDFNNATCLAALQELCNIYEYEFYIQRIGGEKWQINISNDGTEMPITFKYGRGRGLFNIIRRNINNKSII